MAMAQVSIHMHIGRCRSFGVFYSTGKELDDAGPCPPISTSLLHVQPYSSTSPPTSMVETPSRAMLSAHGRQDKSCRAFCWESLPFLSSRKGRIGEKTKISMAVDLVILQSPKAYYASQIVEVQPCCTNLWPFRVATQIMACIERRASNSPALRTPFRSPDSTPAPTACTNRIESNPIKPIRIPTRPIQHQRPLPQPSQHQPPPSHPQPPAPSPQPP